MKNYTSTQRTTFRIGVVDEDPCAMHYVSSLVQHLQNLNGCRLDIWQTTKPQKALHNCQFGTHPTDVVLLDMRLREIAEDIKESNPEIAIIGMSMHVEPTLKFLEDPEDFYTVADKSNIRQELTKALHTIYQDRTLQAKRSPAPPPANTRRHSTSHRSNYLQRLRAVPAESQVARNLPNSTAADNEVAITLPKSGAMPDDGEPVPVLRRDFRSQGPQRVNLKRTTLRTVPLSPSEKRIMTMSLADKTPTEIAKELELSNSTVYSHRHSIRLKLHAETWEQAETLYRKQLYGTG
ncbi:LuxR C-terminal-related transcriptional regulator [Bifidobacterium sp. ESL0790]|uniref:DNA-binding response regulator n=1 Tax=Bifidobacterium sp. ESL0790 TaxID=2983233 RepID=UPI0023F95E80|nr:LuxR C-terminal-related transcriptional regulator [Bifidobacterium sp. ESL0790]WEV72750.1 LuxR C-terminal-related transcriptional regulator [Bifidobacterium sp. ESL0790]